MKKLFALLVVLFSLFMLSGCEKATKSGNYKEGTYQGSVSFESYGSKYVTTAVLYVDKNGKIASCYIDSTYTKDGVNTTKKTLGDAYGMKATSEAKGVIDGGAEWYEQVSQIEKKVVDEQGIDWVKWTDDTNTYLDLDVVSGVTISANTYIEAISKALEQAK